MKGVLERPRADRRWTARENEFLLETSRLLSSSLDIATILERLSQRLVEVFPGSRSGILLLDEQGEHLVLAAGYGTGLLEEEAGRRRLEPQLYPEIERAAQTREPVVIEDVRDNPLMEPVLPLIVPTGLRSLLCVPLLAGERFLGILSIGCFGAPRSFRPREVALCQTIAYHAAVALENARLYEKVQGMNRELERQVEERTRWLEKALRQTGLINQIARASAAALDPDEAARTAVERLREGLSLEAVLVLWCGEAGASLRPRAVAHESRKRADRLAERELRADRGIPGHVARGGRPYLANDTGDDPVYAGFGVGESRSELCVPIRLEGKVCGVLDIHSRERGAFDSTDRRTLEALADVLAVAFENGRLFAAVERERAFTDEVVENLSGGLIVTDAHGVVRRANHSACQVLRVERDEIEGSELEGLFPDMSQMFEFDADGGAREVEVGLRDGDRIPLGYASSFFARDRGGMEAVILSFRDLSELKQLEERVRRKERLADIGELAGRVAHEVRNPLFGISSSAQVMLRELPRDSSHLALARGMVAEARRLEALVEDLLAYGRPRGPSVSEVDLAALLGEVLSVHGSGATARGLELEAELPDEMPGHADPDMLKSAFLNLLRNAFQAASNRVRVQLAREGDEAVCSVEEDGPGVPEELWEGIFQPFFTTKKGEGSGIGLALCRKVAEEHDGTVRCGRSELGGARFELRIPLRGGVRPCRHES